MFGKVIDTTCVLWKFECRQRKNCLVYDVESFRYKFAGGCIELTLTVVNTPTHSQCTYLRT